MTFKHSKLFVYYLKIFSAYGLSSLFCIKYTPKPAAKTFQAQLRLSSEPDKEHISHQKLSILKSSPSFLVETTKPVSFKSRVKN